MEIREPIKFTIGEEYKNEKGLFEVMAIKGKEMVIRWETGEEITCDMRVQLRIQERRRWEKRRREKAAAAKLAPSSASKASRPFEGLCTEDFQDKISRTPWRSRNQLGGAVSRLLRVKHPHFNSWAAKRRNAVHWADAGHWKESQAVCGVKFSACANGVEFVWGLHVVRPHLEAAAAKDWEALVKWLEYESNESSFKDLAIEAGLNVYDARQPELACVLSPNEAGWIAEGGKDSKIYDSLRAAIDGLPGAAGNDLMIARKIPKEDVVGRGIDIAQDVAELMERLLPLYEAAINRRA